MLSHQQRCDFQIISLFLLSVSFTWEKHEMVEQFSTLADLLGYRIKQEKLHSISFSDNPGSYSLIFLHGCNERIDSIYIDIETFYDTYELLQEDQAYEQIEEIVNGKLQKLEEAVQYLRTVWGEPFFLGDFWDSRFPRDQYSGIRMALWKMKGAHVVLQVEYQDKELPISLNMLITPEQELTSHEFDEFVGKEYLDTYKFSRVRPD
ncbi:hypothetical protein [Thermoflavimicrobium dichotomicum]|uniref:Uncharacterized protein n=1 Tax=Thermoflavimicrobium dichotomicum TaxID=46223 RepID=A0A1I3RTQ0_9BACL|nr:hypothetical protein [Thermoflavimicrobium dichotomicum]SFJ49725.1 hypothetical protein SAMN05421852_11125 [Thermoflavimicrobium dichotomicum]